jgi:hypothetical protein
VNGAKLRWDNHYGVRETVRFDLSPELDRLFVGFGDHMRGCDDVEQFWHPWTLEPVLPVATIAEQFRAFDAGVQALRAEDDAKKRASQEAQERFAAAFNDIAGQGEH